MEGSSQNPPAVPSIDRIIGAGVPTDALGFYGRWWQLENWLRELVYVELRAKYGSGWTAKVRKTASDRAADDLEANRYMASADAGDVLLYTDINDLFRLIEQDWNLFKPFLPPSRRWQGVADELRVLRNRNAHCRRPHRDDVPRLEQVLRDLEYGAWSFYGTYLDTSVPHRRARDPLVRDWLNGKHEDASRLLEHADSQYDVRFRLESSARPWMLPQAGSPLSGQAGVLWHAVWIFGARNINVWSLWRDVQRVPSLDKLLIHLLADLGHVRATFSAIDDAQEIADSIGRLFDLILMNSRASASGQTTDEWLETWRRGAEHLPARVQVETPLTLIDPHHLHAFSIFSA